MYYWLTFYKALKISLIIRQFYYWVKLWFELDLIGYQVTKSGIEAKMQYSKATFSQFHGFPHH